MARGPLLTDAEIRRAIALRPLTWRTIAARLGRDHRGLMRACARARNAPQEQANNENVRALRGELW